MLYVVCILALLAGATGEDKAPASTGTTTTSGTPDVKLPDVQTPDVKTPDVKPTDAGQLLNVNVNLGGGPLGKGNGKAKGRPFANGGFMPPGQAGKAGKDCPPTGILCVALLCPPEQQQMQYANGCPTCPKCLVTVDVGGSNPGPGKGKGKGANCPTTADLACVALLCPLSQQRMQYANGCPTCPKCLVTAEVGGVTLPNVTLPNPFDKTPGGKGKDCPSTASLLCVALLCPVEQQQMQYKDGCPTCPKCLVTVDVGGISLPPTPQLPQLPGGTSGKDCPPTGALACIDLLCPASQQQMQYKDGCATCPKCVVNVDVGDVTLPTTPALPTGGN